MTSTIVVLMFNQMCVSSGTEMVVGVCLDCDKPDPRRFDMIYYHQSSNTNNDAPGLKMQHCHKAQHKHVEQKTHLH